MSEQMRSQQRPLRPSELALLLHMLRDKPNTVRLLAALPTSQVKQMNDGGMGSLLFVSDKPSQKLGDVVAEVQFLDADGVPLIASLNLDEDGDLFELDMFKADFSPLQRLPIL